MNKKKQFQLLRVMSFITLMQDMANVAPRYVLEKWGIIRNCGSWEAFSMLDSSNRQKLFDWGDKWGIDFQSLVNEAENDYWNMPAPKYIKKYGLEDRFGD